MLEGGCRCGAVRYALEADRLPPVYCCHCLSCQSGSGSAFSQQAVVREAAISADGALLDYIFAREGGGQGHHRLCASCYTRLWSTSSGLPGVALLRAGTLDRSQEILPVAHIWTQRKQPWIELPQGVPQWPGNAPMDKMARLLA